METSVKCFKIGKPIGNEQQYKIVGPPSNRDWIHGLRVNPEEAWCCFSVVNNDWIGGFGGEVWPGAWPEFFASPPKGNYAHGPNTLTAAGKALIAHAEPML